MSYGHSLIPIEDFKRTRYVPNTLLSFGLSNVLEDIA